MHVCVPRSKEANTHIFSDAHLWSTDSIKVKKDYTVLLIQLDGNLASDVLDSIKYKRVLDSIKYKSWHLPIEKQANVVYEIPCTCGKVYIGETKRCLGTRLKEHKDACGRCQTDKSAITEHAWAEDHPINWSGTKILQRTSHTMELVMKETLCIKSTPAGSRFNRDSGYELPDCWFALNRKLRGGAIVGHRAPLTGRMRSTT